MIRNATQLDIPALEELYKQRVLYNDEHDIHQWNIEDITWATLSKTYTIENFYVLEVDNELCGAICLVDFDPTYWAEVQKGKSLFLHKLCVSANHAKKGYADALITFFKEKAEELGYQDARLDVREHKKKLRQMYERNGFQLFTCRSLFPEYVTALYIFRF